MTPTSITRLLFTAAILGIGSNVAAQGHDERCSAKVGELCGAVSASECFSDESKWERLPEECTGDVQTMIEMEREAGEAGEGEPGGIDRQDVRDLEGNVYGMSYGGRLRASPDMDSAMVAGLAEGERLRILENTGVEFDGYIWYRVLTPQGEGFHWGGIFCSDTEESLPGVLSRCQDGMSGTTPEEKTKASKAVILRGDGLATIDGKKLPFGTGIDVAIERLQTALDETPSGRDALDQCGPGKIEVVNWDSGLTAFFKGGRFVGWSSIDQRSAEGIGFGSSRAEVVAAYDPKITSDPSGERFSVDGLIGVFDSDADDAQVSAFWAGMACMD